MNSTPPARRALALGMLLLTVSISPTRLPGQDPAEGDDQPVCQDYGNFPDVGGRRVCAHSNGQVCTYTSVENGVTKNCTLG